MPRFARLHRPFALHHIIGRFVNRAFRLSCDMERDEYLRRLWHALGQADWTLLGYALMSSHVHLCAVAGLDPSAQLMRPLHGGFAHWLNRRHGTLGPVFAERHTVVVMEPGHAQRLLAYLHNNPVRARVVREAAASRWTSHRAYLGLEPSPTGLDIGRGLRLCGLSTDDAGRRTFDEQVRARGAAPRDPELSGGGGARVRTATRAELGAPVEVSGPLLTSEGPAHVVIAPRDLALRPRWTGAPAEVLEEVAERTGVTVERMRAQDRAREVAGARRLALLTWTRHLGRSQGEMARVLGLSAQAGSALLRRRPQQVAAAAAAAVAIAARCLQSKS